MQTPDSYTESYHSEAEVLCRKRMQSRRRWIASWARGALWVCAWCFLLGLILSASAGWR